MSQILTLKIDYTISAEEYQRLKDHSAMLGRIAGVVSRYAHTPETTTYECVVALNERVRTLNAKVRNHKNAGGQIPRMNDKVSDGGPLTHESKQGANPPFAAPLG